jgi:hypothetical protein
MNMVAELPRYIGDMSIPTGAQVACLEAFFSNLKLLIEFAALPRSRKRGDNIHAQDFLPKWKAESPDWVPVKHMYGDINAHVSHLGRQRVPMQIPAEFYRVVGRRELEDQARMMFDAMKGFVRALQDDGSPYAGQFESFLLQARLRLEG